MKYAPSWDFLHHQKTIDTDIFVISKMISLKASKQDHSSKPFKRDFDQKLQPGTSLTSSSFYSSHYQVKVNFSSVNYSINI